MKLVDAHIHCSELPDDELINFARFNGLEYNLTELLNLMEENEVQLGLLLSPPISGGIPAPNSRNEYSLVRRATTNYSLFLQLNRRKMKSFFR